MPIPPVTRVSDLISGGFKVNNIHDRMVLKCKKKLNFFTNQVFPNRREGSLTWEKFPHFPLSSLFFWARGGEGDSLRESE